MSRCIHCESPCAQGQQYCCNGCKAAAEMLSDAEGEGFAIFAQTNEQGEHQLTLTVEGIHCASCVQLIENVLLGEESVTQARVNMSMKRLQLHWNGNKNLGDMLAQRVESLGYKLTAFDASKIVDSQQNEAKHLLRAIAVSGFAMGNVMLLSVVLWSSSSQLMGMATRDFMHFISALIAIPAIAYAGRPFFTSAWSVLRQGHTNMDVPISLAVVLASSMSLWETIRHGEHIYFDSAIMLVFFLLIGRYLDARAKGKARDSAQILLSMLEGTATLIEGKKHRVIPIKELREGMKLHVAMGEKIPTDSIVQEGSSELDTSLITGETVPRIVESDAYVFAGTINLSAPLVLSVAKASEESLLSDIVKLMEQAEQGQAEYVRLADRAARLYTPLVHSLGLLTFMGWWLWMGIAWQESLMVAVTVLIITCPCALGLAVPVVQVLASSKLMKRGILLKSGDALEKLASIHHVVFDKTGTLTLGRPTLRRVDGHQHRDMAGGSDMAEVTPLQIAASLAAHSRHPYSKAIAQAYEGELLALEAVEEVPGVGVHALYQGLKVRLGKSDEQIMLPPQEASEARIWLVVEAEEPYCFTLDDVLREDASTVLKQLSQGGLSIQLLSGDRAVTTKQVAQQVGIENWQGDLSPLDKASIIQRYEQKGQRVLMVGDGLNDAPALASATVSMSPASAMDITQNTADIVFQGAGLSPVILAWETAKQATMLVKQNFALAVVYNIIAIPLAVMGYVTPFIAAIAMSGSSLLVIANSFRLNRGKA